MPDDHEVVIETESGSLRLVPFKATDAAPPSLFLSNVNWTFFSYSLEFGYPNAVWFAKLYKHNGSSPSMAIMQRVHSSLWAFATLESSIAVKDISTLAEPQVAFSSSVTFSSCIQTPTWTEDPDVDLDLELDPPQSISRPRLPPKAASDPEKLLQFKYFDSLYLSRTSLGYFVKSTLSKVRALCPDNVQYCKHLSARILSVDKVDSKHDPAWLSAYTARLDVNDSTDDTTLSRLSCKDELAFLSLWSSQLPDDASQRQLALSDLKLRELQLQLILLLEVIASQKPDDDATSAPKEKPKPRPQLVRRRRRPNTPDTANPNGSEGEKAIDSEVLADVLFDRLCIWQALHDPPKVDGREASPDKLQDFCMEVLMPFYGHRLRDRVKAMVKKASGRTGSRLPSRSIRSQSARSEPTDHTAERSDSMKPESQKDSMPALIAGTRKASIRGGVQTSIAQDLHRRQVDVRSDQVSKEELAQVIRNISKPNRDSVAQEFDSQASRLSLVGMGRSKARATKSRTTKAKSKPVLQVAGPGLTTPSKRRVVPTLTPVKRLKSESPTSSPTLVEATPVKSIKHSTEKPLSEQMYVIGSTPRHQRTLDFVQSTPSHDREVDVIEATPSTNRKIDIVQATPNKEFDLVHSSPIRRLTPRRVENQHSPIGSPSDADTDDDTNMLPGTNH
uniref:ARAD1C23386p n=1 Tax=Blastobotrys adeninivorans TaxID=409370 RepID=A0A060T1B2_BLAAD